MSICSVSEQMVWTPFYRFINKTEVVDYIEEPLFNYKPYNLFVLKTLLYPWIQKKINKDLTISFISKPRKDKLYLTVVLLNGGIPFKLNLPQIKDLQSKVDQITSSPLRGALIFSYSTFLANNGRLLPRAWLDDILPYINLNEELNSYITHDGIMVELGQLVEYKRIYSKLVDKISNTISHMYISGFIVNPSQKIIENWNLVEVGDDKQLYHPTWVDLRITRSYGSLTDFLLSRINGDLSVNYYVTSNWFTRHQIARHLSKLFFNVTFINDYARILINNLSEAQKVASVIDQQISTGIGKVTTLLANRSSWITLYIYSAKQLGYNDCLGYKITNPNRSWIFSCVIPLNGNINYYKLNIRIKAFEILNKLFLKYPNNDIHSLIELDQISLE